MLDTKTGLQESLTTIYIYFI